MKKKLLVLISIMMCIMCFTACGTKKGEKSVRGSWSDNVYTNEFAGITFELPENWVYATDEEMNNTYENAKDVVSEADKELLETGDFKSLNEMMAQNMYTGSNVIISYENLAKVVGGSQITEEKYIDIVKTQLNDVETFTYELGETTTAKLGDEEFLSLRAKLKGTEMEQAYYLKKIDTYMVNIVVTSSNADESLDEITAYFK